MKYYKDDNNQIYAYEADGSQDAFISPILIPISFDEANSILNPVPTPEQLLEIEQQKVINLLAESDKYMSRACEDLIVMLLNKGSIIKSDYHQIVWDRINYRRSLRNQQPI